MAHGLHGARRPRPVADVPPPALADGVAPAKAWLVALVAAAPLAEAGDLPVAELAAGGPPLCAALLRAVGSDRELERLLPGGDAAGVAARAGRLAGAADPAAVAGAVGVLRAALWDALLDELDRRDAELVAAAATRVAHVCDVVAQAALAAGASGGGGIGAGGRPRPGAGPRPEAEAGPGTAALATPPALTPVPSLGGEGDGDGGGDVAPRRGPVGVVPDVPLAAIGPLPDAAPEVVARRTGGRAGGAGASVEPWVDAVAARLERHAEDGGPFAVLVVEVDDAERVLAADGDGEALRAITRAEGAVRRAARAADAVVREHPGRLWVVVPVDDAPAARALGERLADAAATVALRDAPLTVSIGFATCPEDGADADALTAHADEGVFAARAAGVRLA